MNLEMSMALELVKEAEGFEPNEYFCTAKKRTKGYGRNLEVHPLSDEEKAELNEDGSVSEEVAEKWALKELKECEYKLSQNIIYQKQSDVRKAVLLHILAEEQLKNLNQEYQNEFKRRTIIIRKRCN